MRGKDLGEEAYSYQYMDSPRQYVGDRQRRTHTHTNQRARHREAVEAHLDPQI